MFYCYVKHRMGDKEAREMKGERVNQSQFFKVAWVDIICLS